MVSRKLPGWEDGFGIYKLDLGAGDNQGQQRMIAGELTTTEIVWKKKSSSNPGNQQLKTKFRKDAKHT